MTKTKSTTNLVVQFILSPFGWRVEKVVALDHPVVRKVITDKETNSLILTGAFKAQPRPGQFCVRPHRFI
ncbi:hypothetical protein [Methylovorus glucosotrophus]|uniref:Uncharacterized protein n=1 Tax=Methylovorus glucosotrophus (strain SIP3-4) TaxID=582744 RepID=C6XEC4_METGS|nr:hypothetical protein [Methylovorus glucosotrophus]ACT50899.1 hypothetical protein Msip34_1654 [Methylovorus glucosotrophus SIP3-4]